MHNVLEWLEASAQRTPDATAFADAHRSLTFDQLQTQARTIGAWVAARVDECRPVPLYLEKSTYAIAAMMGAVYARCCYCVLDVRQPAARLNQILDTLEPQVLLTDAANEQAARELFGSAGFEIAVIEDLLETEVAHDALLSAVAATLLDVRRRRSVSTDPLYINFTSGSTGTPKGVVVGHASVIDFIEQFTSLFGITAADRIANQAPFDFDVSVKDIYSGLCTGAAVHMIPREYFSVPVQLMDFLVERDVTVCTWAVSAMCFVSIMNAFDYKVPQNIRCVIFSGEVMPPKQLAKWRKYLPNATYVNVYGPTEVTCNCTYYVIEREFAKDEVIPMGRPFENEKVFLLDERGELVTRPGAEGEICVGGECLALGYYGEPERTAKVFVQNPLNSAYRETVYRTGDLASYDVHGDLVYAGRKDHQIKHLGQRIELGEIDAVAQAAEGVSRACTIYNAKKKRILLFFAGSLEKDALAEYLHEKLPSFMAPNKIFALDELPLNKNGKIDRAALEELGGVRK